MKKEISAVLLLVSILMLISFLSSLDFSNTGFEGLIGESVFQKRDVDIKSVKLSQEEASLSENSNPPCVPLFVVSGLDEGHYRLRTGVSSQYSNGKWVMDELSYKDAMRFSAGKIFSVTPITGFEGNLPVVKDTIAVSAPAGYNSSACLFRVDLWNDSYYGVYVPSRVESHFSGDAKLARIDIEGWKMERIRELAYKITENATSDYERLKMIESYLQNHYEYSPRYNRSADMIYDFLFVERKGICMHFASAFIALATSLDIPVRAVFGYMASPTSSSQVVYSCQAHMWVEAKLGDVWVEFDPTPPARYKIPTTTEITYWDREVVEGGNVTVRGVVRLDSGEPVESGYVEVYLKMSKESPEGELLGIARLSNGTFELSAKVNESGTYSLVAHYTGSLLYQDSWSDPEVRVLAPTEIVVNLPSYVPLSFRLEGKLVSDGEGVGNKTVIVEVDGRREVVKTDEAGSFAVNLTLSEGEHRIRIVSPKEGLYAEAVLEKNVTAGSFSFALENKTLVAMKENAVNLTVLFNSHPFSGVVRVNGIPVSVEDGRATLTLVPEKPGIVEIAVGVGGFEDVLEARAKLPVEIKAEEKDGRLEIMVVDAAGNPVDGAIYVNGQQVTLIEGVARVEMEGSEFRISYPGDELHFPAEVTYEVHRPWYLLSIPILAAAGVWYYRNMPRLRVELEKEHPEMPNIWKAGEEIRVRVESNLPFAVAVDGEVSGTSVRFESPGKHAIRVNAIKDGRVRKVREIEIRIVEDYGEAVEEVFRMFEREVMRRRGIDCRTMTAREVMEALGVKDERLLRLFELYEYAGTRGYTRKEFVEAFEIYMSLRRVIG
ncbi:Transglutaminase-like superfamily [Geoglobus ahangari]|uniref:Transglutaminase-like superfamily n=1 Tax=Geoglobus ahangari TaxID=113653 RepID=A0A0F7IGU7_9EURY|nr:transglutaminase-like domain-containing protein [Geoglobus ahangari]AKG91175.1 Transglutaminase-like superfamily [Geoglobus ahangari]